MLRIGFTAPALDTLISRALSLSADYYRRRPQAHNPVREQQLNEIELIHRHILELKNKTPRDAEWTDECLLKLSVGAWICALEKIECEYISHNPLPSNNPILSYGSVLSQLITNTLSISDVNKLDDESRLIYLAELYHFDMCQANDEIKHHIESAISSVLNRLMNKIKKLIAAIPAPEVLQAEFATLYSRYAQKRLVPLPFYASRVDEDRPFCAQLGQVVAGLLNLSDASNNPDQVERHYKVMLGLLIYIMRTINSRNSKLYELCNNMMNGGPNTLSPVEQFNCLVTLDNFLKDNNILMRIAEEGRRQFGKENRLVNLDSKLRMLSMKLENELKELQPDQSTSMMGAKTFAVAGALASYPVGYGTGRVLGTVGAGAEMKMNANLKEFITRWINDNAHYLLGVRGNGVGYLATTPIVTAIYQTVAGNLLGSAFALAGGLVAGSVGFLVVDLVLRNLYQHLVQHAGHYRDPLYAANFDKTLLACLENLPDNLLNEEKKKKMARVGGFNHRLMQMNQGHDDKLPEKYLECGGIVQMP